MAHYGALYISDGKAINVAAPGKNFPLPQSRWARWPMGEQGERSHVGHRRC